MCPVFTCVSTVLKRSENKFELNCMMLGTVFMLGDENKYDAKNAI